MDTHSDPDWIPDEEEVSLYDVVVAVETELALLVRVPETGREAWVPRSVVCEGSEVRSLGDRGRLDVRVWWLEKGDGSEPLR
jgi:hypothetical protein